MNHLRWGILGAGRFGQIHAEVLSDTEGVELTAICNRSPQKLEEAGNRFDIPCRYTDALALLQSDIDVVSITTHWEEHCELALAALEAGKHVLLEKPMATSRHECEQLVGAAEHAPGKFLVGHVCRFDPRVAQAKQLIREGKLGRIVSMHARRNLPVAPGSVRLDKISPLMGDGVHDADLMMWFLDAVPDRVYGRTVRVHDFRYPDIGWAMLQFDELAVGVVETNWALPPASPTVIDAVLEITGTEGSLRVDCATGGLSYVDDRLRYVDSNYWPLLHGRRVGALRNEIEYFVRCIREDREVDVIRPSEAALAVAVMEAAEQSARTKEVVEVKAWQ